MPRSYETIFVLDTSLDREIIEAEVNKVTDLISSNGGNVIGVDRWGVKRFAFEIKKRQQGYYVMVRFDSEPDVLQKLEGFYRFNEPTVRFMTVLSHPKARRLFEAKAPAPAEKEPEKKEEETAAPETDAETPAEPETTEETTEQNPL